MDDLYRVALGPLAQDRLARLVTGVYGSSCVIHRKTGKTSDGRGRGRDVYTPDPAPVRCDVQYGISTEEAVNQRYEGRILGTILLPEGVTVGMGDYIVPDGGGVHRVAGPPFANSDEPGLNVPVVMTEGDTGE